MTRLAHVDALVNHVAGALHRSVRMADDAALVASDPDVTQAIAQLVARDTDIPVRLVSWPASLPAAQPVRQAAQRAGLPLVERFGPPPTFTELIKEAGRQSRRILLLDGHQLLGGAVEAEVRQVEQERRLAAEALRLQPRFPLLDRGVVPFLVRLRHGGNPPAEGWWNAMATRLDTSKS